MAASPDDDSMDGATLVAPSTSGSGDVTAVRAQILAGRYAVEALLGVGGMGAVYRARDIELDEVVALKMLRHELVSVPGILERFRQEVKLARKVTSPNVARTFDIGEHQGEKFLTMELVDGESLAAQLDREGIPSFSRAIAISLEVCEGLAAAHSVGVVHRDLKPDNVLIGKDGRIKITDFGIAKAQADAKKTQGVTGTPAYMAPEQVTGDANIDPRADIYALGVMLYEMLTGRMPWTGDSSIAIATARLLAAPPDVRALCPELPAGLGELVLRCMARSKNDRPASARDVAEALANIARTPVPEARQFRPSGAPATPRETGLKTLAVLPLRNGGAPDDEYLADGLTDDLIDSLSMARGLRVRPRGMVMRFKGKDRDPRELGRELDVQVFVDGSVRRAGDTLRVSMRLVSVADGFQLWARRFDRPAADVLAIGDEVAQAITNALTVDAAPVKRELPRDAVAVDLYLRARHEYFTFGVEGTTRALRLFEQALERTPDDPMILAGYTMARTAYLANRDCSQKEVRDMLVVAQRAVALAPQLADAHIALASGLLHDGRSADAAREARLAVEIAPSNAEGHFQVGRLLGEAGRVPEALARLEIARKIDPRVKIAVIETARLHALMGDWARSDELMAIAREDEGDSPYLYWGNLFRFVSWRGDPAVIDSTIEAAKKSAVRDHEMVRHWTIVFGHGDAEAQRRSFEAFGINLESSSRRRALGWQLRAELAGFRGDLDEVLSDIESADASLLTDVLWMDRCPLLGAARNEARFARVRERVANRAAGIVLALSGA